MTISDVFDCISPLRCFHSCSVSSMILRLFYSIVYTGMVRRFDSLVEIYVLFNTNSKFSLAEEEFVFEDTKVFTKSLDQNKLILLKNRCQKVTTKNGVVKILFSIYFLKTSANFGIFLWNLVLWGFFTLISFFWLIFLFFYYCVQF